MNFKKIEKNFLPFFTIFTFLAFLRHPNDQKMFQRGRSQFFHVLKHQNFFWQNWGTLSPIVFGPAWIQSLGKFWKIYEKNAELKICVRPRYIEPEIEKYWSEVEGVWRMKLNILLRRDKDKSPSTLVNILQKSITFARDHAIGANFDKNINFDAKFHRRNYFRKNMNLMSKLC